MRPLDITVEEELEREADRLLQRHPLNGTHMNAIEVYEMSCLRERALHRLRDLRGENEELRTKLEARNGRSV